VSNDDCPDDKREELFCAVLCNTIVHSDMHTREQFLSVNCWFRFKFEFIFAFCMFFCHFILRLFAFVVLGLVFQC